MWSGFSKKDENTKRVQLRKKFYNGYTTIFTCSATLNNGSSNSFPNQIPRAKHCFTTRATADDNKPGTTQEPGSNPGSAYDDQFERWLPRPDSDTEAGTGKKAELRKAKKGKSSSGSGSGMYLPPVPLKESVSGGLKVEFGFSPYSEREGRNSWAISFVISSGACNG
ncbi:hypothetical protein OIU78_005624 [Salix suchowensis]|nr:hypothetical protein OIU78_005624 [Salix suchowensis]